MFVDAGDVVGISDSVYLKVAEVTDVVSLQQQLDNTTGGYVVSGFHQHLYTVFCHCFHLEKKNRQKYEFAAVFFLYSIVIKYF